MLVHLIRRAQMVPVLGGKVEEGEQSFPVFRQAGDRFLVLGAVFVGEHVDRRFGRRARWRAVDFTKVSFHVDLDREGDLVQHIRGLMDPTSLMPGAGKDLLDCLPEAERPVVDRGCTGAGGETARSEMLAVMPSPPGPPMTLGNMRMLGPCSRTASANALPEAGAPPDMSARPSRGDALRNAVSGGPCVGCFF